MVKLGRSFSQKSIHRNIDMCNSSGGDASFSIKGPVIQESAVSMSYAASRGTTSAAFDVASLLAAVGGEHMQYIEFNSVRRELEPRQRWPLLGIVSQLLDQPEWPADVAKPVVMHNNGAAL